MTKVSPFIQSLVEDVCGPIKNVKKGSVIKHPDGYKVKIVSGQFWGEFGVSNFWYWKKFKKDGTLTKKTYNGYGWW